MLKRLSQAAALIVLCVLLVYAPEIFKAVSGPYQSSTPKRILLRVVLCTQDADAASSFYKALSGFRKAHPSYHLRVTRADAGQMLALTEPLPDVYLFPSDIEQAPALMPERLFLPLSVPQEADDAVPGLWDGVRYAYPYVPEKGETLLFAVGVRAHEALAAHELIAYLREISVPTPSVP